MEACEAVVNAIVPVPFNLVADGEQGVVVELSRNTLSTPAE